MSNKLSLKRCFTFFVLSFFMFASVYAQQLKVSGKVTDASTNETLPGVNVAVKGSGTGTSTDGNGNYSISVSRGGILVFSFVGYAAQEITVGTTATINVALQAEATQLSEVVVTGLGIKRDKRSLGYAVQQIKAEQITELAPVDIAQGLMGKVAGLNISTANGLTNASSRITIRGNNSLFGNNQPLVVIDGAILENRSLSQSNTENSLGGYQDWGNYLSYMNMDNVESVSVLKGPNAAALYGAKGANGVILITSKKGLAKKGIGVEYGLSSTYTNAYRYLDVQNEYGIGFSGALFTANQKLPKTATGQYYIPTLYPGSWQANGGNKYAVGGSGIEGSHGPIPDGRNTWDQFSWYGAGSSWGAKMDGTPALWWDGVVRPYSPQPNNREYMFQTGTSNTHNLAFSAANDLGSVRMAASVTNGTQPVPNVNNSSKNFSLGSNYKISKVFSAELSAAYNQNSRLNAPELGTNNSWSKFMIYGMSREYVPLEKAMYRNPDGSKNEFPGAYPYNEYSRDMFWAVYEHNQRLSRDEFLTTFKLNAEITPWLNAFVRTSADIISTRFESTNTTTNPDKVSGGSFSKTVSRDRIFNTDIMVTAHKEDFLLSGLNASASAMYNTYSTNSVGVSGSNWSRFAVPGVYSLGNWVTREQTGMSESRFDIQSVSALGMVNLNYNNFLFLDLTGRQDITSTLPKDNNSTFYPSGSAAFVFTEVIDIPKEILSYGKLRLAYGKSANGAQPYQLDNTYDVGNFGGQPTNYLPSTIPPYALQFQTSVSVEGGLNLGFLNDRLNLDFTYYNILSANQILQAALPASSGATLVSFNSGKLRNKGIEFIINGTPVMTDKFMWSMTLNLAKNTNIIEELAQGVKEQWLGDIFGNLGVVMKVAPGQEYGAIYGTDFLLDDQGRKQIKNIVDSKGNVVGTEYLITNEQVLIGNAAPKLTGGFGNNLRYKGFSLYALIDFKLGGDIYSVDHATAMGSGLLPETLVERNGGGLPYTYPDGTTANHGVILEGYNVTDGKANDRVVHYLYKYGNQYAGWSHLNRPRSLSVFENSWVKLRELALSYDIPSSIVGKTKIFQGLTLSVFGRNLFYIYSSLPDNLNPEAINGTGNAQGLQWSAYPSFRSLGFSLKAKF